MALQYSDEKLAAMAKSFLNNYMKDPSHLGACNNLINILGHHFKLSREEVLEKIKEYGDYEF